VRPVHLLPARAGAAGGARIVAVGAIGEVAATFGLVVVIFGVVRSGRAAHVAYAVVADITAYWFTSSTSFANPTITIGRTLSDTFAGIEPASVPLFVLMQLLGGALAVGAVRVLYPRAAQLAEDLTSWGDRP
jgi:glycerol uptake facilitator-like aquaporin